LAVNDRLPKAVAESGYDEGLHSASLTISIVSHGHLHDCELLISDLARIASPCVARVILTLNIPEEAPYPASLPFEFSIVRNLRPKGFAANHNAAFGLVTTPYFVVLNPDVRIASDPFPKLLAQVANPCVAVTSPVIMNPSGGRADFERRLISPLDIVWRRVSYVERRMRPRPPEWLAGIFMAFRTETYRRLGGFHPRFHLYCEDADLCARARLLGLNLNVVHEVAVVHGGRRASHRSPRHFFMHVSSLVKFLTSPVYRHYRDMLREESTVYRRQSKGTSLAP